MVRRAVNYLAVLFVFGCVTFGGFGSKAMMPVALAQSSYVAGDVNCNGCVTLIDAVDLMLNLFLSEDSECRCQASRDANGDGAVNVTDTIFILDFVVLGGPAPSPFPSCGRRGDADVGDVAGGIGGIGGVDLPCESYPEKLCVRPRFKRGDVNCDGCVDLKDADLLSDHIFVGTPVPCDCFDAMDANGNGELTVEDSIYIANFVCGNGAPPPSPGPYVCGPSPAEVPNCREGHPYRSCCTGCRNQLPGDCNQDGVLDISDPLCLLGFIIIGDPEELPCGSKGAGHLLMDCDGSGLADINDAICFLNFLILDSNAEPFWGTDFRYIETCPMVAPRPRCDSR